MKNILKHFDFSLTFGQLLLILLVITSPFTINYIPQNMSYENSLLENIQVLILLFGIIICLKTRDSFFYFVAMVLFILILREINFGRVFFPKPNNIHSFLSYNEIKYGYLLKYFGYSFIGYTTLYFFIKKLYTNLFKYLHSKIPFFACLICGICALIATIAEPLEYVITEEIFETLFYISIINIVYLYASHNRYIFK